MLLLKKREILFYPLQITLVLLLVLILHNNALSQHVTKTPLDTVFLNRGSMIVIGKKKIIPVSDTVVIIPRKPSYKIKKVKNRKEDLFYDSLKTKASRHKFTNQLYNLLITRNQSDQARINSQTISAESEFAKYNEKTIRNIIVKRYEPFGSSVFDTTLKAESWIEKSLNAIHILTIENVIRANLIVKKGDKVNSYILAENERILRNLPYMYDARIYASNTKSDSVDIYVITRDLWSIGLIPDLGIRAGNIELYDLNYLGLGNALSAQLFYDRDSSQHIGYRFGYNLNNIKNTFIDAGVFYQNVYNIEEFGFFGSKGFITTQVKYGGGIEMTKTNEYYYFNSLNTENSKIPVRYLSSDAWFGKSFVISKTKKNINSLRLVLSLGYSDKYYSERPFVDKDSNKIYHRSDLILGNLSLSNRKYYKGNLIYAFGTIEDIPHGFLIDATFGPEKREFSNRFYYGLQLSAGDFVGDFGYLHALVGVGGYKNGANLEQGVLRFSINTFSNLYYSTNYRYRNFMNVNYVIGFNRFNGEYIRMDYEEIVMYSNMMIGTQKLSAKFETVAFTPVDFYGFKVAFFGFWDLGILGSNQHFILSEKYFLGLGTGLRIRNDNLVFQTFQLNMAYYPLLPSGGSGFVFGISGQNILKLFDFMSSKPKEVQFK